MLFGGYTSVFSRNSFSKTIRFLSVFRKSAYTSTALLSLLVLAILCPLYLVPDSSEATAGTATESTLTFAFVNNKNTASVSLDVSNTAGAFASSSSNELAEFSLTTNNATGYTLKLKTTGSTTADTSLVNGANNITSINATKTSSTFTSNTWGLLPSKYRSSNTTVTNDSSDPTFFPADTTGFTMDETSNANNVANTYTVGLGIKADFTIPAGTYTNSTIIAEYVANAVNYSITYDKGNITGTPSNIPATQSGAITSTSITLSSTVPTITGYTFTGWCFGTVTTPANETDTCSGTVYNPNGGGTNLSFGIDQTTTNTVTLHAMWSRATVAVTVNFAGSGVTGVTFTNATYGNQSVSTSGGTANLKYGVQYTIAGTYSSGYEFSSWAASVGTLGSTTTASTTYSTTTASTLTLTGKLSCTPISGTMQAFSPTATTCESGTLTDARDSKTYTVKKLADGNWWMTENLALDLTTLSQAELFGSGTDAGKMTNASNTTLGYLKNGGGTTSDKYPTAKLNNVAWTSSSQNYYSIPMMVSSGSCDSAYCVNNPESGKWKWDAVTTTPINNVSSYAQGKIGIYYNYCAASAGSYCYGNGTSTGSSTDPTTGVRDVTEDICPYGWHLPTSTSSGEFQNLYSKYSGATEGQEKAFQVALSTPLSGYFLSGKARSQGDLGYFWSSTWYNSAYMYNLYILSTFVSPSGSYARSSGSSVRCVFDTSTIADATYMQDVTGNMIKNTATDATATLTDNRDNKTYTVKKLADGKLWMTENLAIDLTDANVQSKLTSATTNATDEALGYLKGTTTGTSSDQWATAAVSNWTSTSYSYTEPWIAVDSTTSGVCSDAYCVNSDKSWSSTSVTSKTINGTTSIAQGKIGVYYNYCAASAGSYCWGNGASYTGSPSSDPNTSSFRDITSDICPYGWYMPISYNSGDFLALYTAYSSNYTNFQTALSTPLSGYFNYGKAYSQGSYGYFWSSTWYRDDKMYSLYVTATSGCITCSLERYYGYSVRCVFGS